MRVVHLDGSLGGQQLDIVVLLAEAAHDVADGAGDQEVLLHQAKFLARSWPNPRDTARAKYFPLAIFCSTARM